MERASLDDVRKFVDEQLIRPVPGRHTRVSDAVVQDEMALFKQAQTSNGR